MKEIKLTNPDEIRNIKYTEDLTLILDIKDIGTQNIGFLANLLSEMEDNEKKLEVKVTSEHIMDIFELVGIATIMPVELIK